MKRTAILLGILTQTNLMSLDSFDYIFDKIEDYGCNAEAKKNNQQQQMHLRKFQNAQVDQKTINYYYEQRNKIDKKTLIQKSKEDNSSKEIEDE